ncbi:UDP-2,3-diacylglucosamine diphosphatase [Fastidiosibacter lacustris]|uniref:UDP-2,3-diacylglucosamine diphosphatase n=1 Tax=Fastidiosibacter lacustris TaxID=2056695 RepID=UPI000E34347A|nr:UDP-2,3-diacylglucosamine diphosphatase [Fastidiosibacter lacustris]
MNKENKKNYYIIADLHLSEVRVQATALFERFLADITNKDNSLYILGDFFDYWIGDDAISPFNLHIADLLAHAHDSGLQIYFMSGNRDFLIGQRFAKRAKITLVSDPHVLVLSKITILLMHGDLLCTDDKSYQIFRKIVRNKLIQWLYLRLPLRLREKLAKGIRITSHKKNAKYKVIDVTEKGIQKYLGKHKTLIHGHTHLFNIHHQQNYIRYVLGDWFKNASYVHIDRHCNIHLLRYFKK